MKHIGFILSIMKFARKEQLEFKTNFVVGTISMIINDILWIMLFVIFLNYFRNTGLNVSDFVLTLTFGTWYYGVIHGLLSNLGQLNDIIEGGKMDYYLTLPKHSLYVLSFSRINPFSFGDLIFGIILSILYSIYFSTDIFVMLKFMIILFFSTFFVVGSYLLIGSLSFWLDKGSEFKDIYEHFFVGFSMYPQAVLKRVLWIFVFVSILGMYPAMFVPYNIIKHGGTIYQWIGLFTISLFVFLLGIYVYHRGLRRYSSGNLIVTN